MPNEMEDHLYGVLNIILDTTQIQQQFFYKSY